MRDNYAYLTTAGQVYTLIQGPTGFDPAACYVGQLPPGTWQVAPDNIELGDQYQNGEWVLAPRPVLPLTRLEFLRRFTSAERIAIRASTDPVVVDFLSLLDAAQEVRTDDADTVAGIGYLATTGLLAAERAAEILSAS